MTNTTQQLLSLKLWKYTKPQMCDDSMSMPTDTRCNRHMTMTINKKSAHTTNTTMTKRQKCTALNSGTHCKHEKRCCMNWVWNELATTQRMYSKSTINNMDHPWWLWHQHNLLQCRDPSVSQPHTLMYSQLVVATVHWHRGFYTAPTLRQLKTTMTHDTWSCCQMLASCTKTALK